MSNKEIMKMIKEISHSTTLLKNNCETINQVIETLRIIKENNNTVFVCGNGGSASTSTHLVCDLSKTSDIKSVCLNDNIALNTALVNDIITKSLKSPRMISNFSCVLFFLSPVNLFLVDILSDE